MASPACSGVNHAQVTEIRDSAVSASQNLKAAIEAVKGGKPISDVIAPLESAMSDIKTITGEVKAAAETVEGSIGQYRETAIELKAAVDAKDFGKAVEIANGLMKRIVEAVPEDKLDGSMKKVYCLVKEITAGIDEKKYEPTVELVRNLVALFEKEQAGAEPAPAEPAAGPEPAKPEPAEPAAK